jgi:hypothetical protein
MQRVTYVVHLDVPEHEAIADARRALEDALESLVVNGRTVDYRHVGSGSGLPEADL